MANYTTTGSDTFPAGHVIQTKVITADLTDNNSNYFSTSATAGAIITTDGGTALSVTSFSLTAGNLLQVEWSAGIVYMTGAGNCIFGVRVDSTTYSCNFAISNTSGTATCNFGKVFSGGLSGVTISAILAAPNGVTRQLYHHDYVAFYTSVWSLTAQEIKM